DQSLALCKEFLAATPKHARAAVVELLVAENEYLAGHYAPAEQAYDRFLQKYPQDASAWRANVRRGLCLAQLNRGDEARELLAQAIKVGGDQDQALRQAA